MNVKLQSYCNRISGSWEAFLVKIVFSEDSKQKNKKQKNNIKPFHEFLICAIE
jgi:predicted secreted acid phosphatase